MGRPQQGQQALGKAVPTFRKRHGKPVRAPPGRVVVSDRLTDGLYSCLGFCAGATRKAIADAYRRECALVKLQRKHAKLPQQRSGATQRQARIDEAWSVLSDAAARAAYDEDNDFIKPGSTARARLRRDQLTVEERQIEQAVNTASKRMKMAGVNGADHEASRLRSVGRKLAKKRKPTAANKRFGSANFIDVWRRSRTERRRKKSRGKFVAVKGARIGV